MIKIDLITGFLGSGKTTFIGKYAKYLMDQGVRLCILENDFGAINVDRVLLQELLGENCGMEMIVGGDGFEAHQRRMRTKLIAMAMSGYERVIVEPSGIFDVDELFDLLYEEPLDRWYEMGSVISIIDAGLSDELSEETEYLLASQCACAGRVILSRTQLVDKGVIDRTITHLNAVMERFRCERRFGEDVAIKAWDDLTEADMKLFAESGFLHTDHVKLPVAEENGYASLFCFHLELPEEELRDRVGGIFQDERCGRVFRIKGFMHTDEGHWIELNATAERIEIRPTGEAQDVLIVIGEDPDKEALRRYLPVR